MSFASVKSWYSQTLLDNKVIVQRMPSFRIKQKVPEDPEAQEQELQVGRITTLTMQMLAWIGGVVKSKRSRAVTHYMHVNTTHTNYLLLLQYYVVKPGNTPPPKKKKNLFKKLYIWFFVEKLFFSLAVVVVPIHLLDCIL